MDRDQTRFAAMSRILGAIGSRRGLVRGGLAALGLGSLGAVVGEADAARRGRWRDRQRGGKRRKGGRGGPGGKGRKGGGTATAAENCTVCDDLDDCPFTSIQAAIDAATAGETITICKETYKEDPHSRRGAGRRCRTGRHGRKLGGDGAGGSDGHHPGSAHHRRGRDGA
jgi:hypothetical protein